MSQPTEPRLATAFWTLAGPVEVGAREWSGRPWRERCAAAQAAGITGLGLSGADVAHQLATGEAASPAEIRAIAEDHGIVDLELELVLGFFLHAGDERAAPFAPGNAAILDAAAELTPHHVKAGNVTGIEAPLDALAEGFARYAAQLAERCDAPLAYELTPLDPVVRTLDDAVTVARAAATGRGGVCLDTWHLGKLGIAPEALADVPADLVTWFELSDGARPRPGATAHDLFVETTTARTFPGEGELAVAAYAAAAARLGYAGPWSVEVFNSDWALRDLAETCAKVADTGRATLRAAGVA